jgi:hypothetical protein
MNDARRDFLQAMAKTLADQGKLIEADLRRLDLIEAELRAYVEELKEDPAFRRGLGR